MITTIENDTDLGAIQDFLNIQSNKRTLAFTLRCLLNHYCHHEELEVQVHKSLFKQNYSYLLNPAQLAKATNIEGHFTRQSGLKRGDYVVFLFTNAAPIALFWDIALAAVVAGNNCNVAKDDVPKTYWNTPSLLKYRLKEASQVPNVRVLKTPTHLKIIVPRKR